MARLLESNEATLSVYDEAAVTATLQHLAPRLYASHDSRYAVPRLLSRQSGEAPQEGIPPHGIAQHPDIRQHALWPAIVGAPPRTNILHQVR